MIKKGIVMDYDGKNAVLFTESGEFISIKTKEKLSIGQEYVYKTKGKIIPKQFLIAASIILVLFLSFFYNLYYTVYASVTVSINPEIRLDINRFDRIINAVPLNEDAKKLLSEAKVKYKKLDNGLIIIVNKAKEKKYINSEYYEGNPKSIKLLVDGKNINLTKFYKEIKKQKLNLNTLDIKTIKNNDNKTKLEKKEKVKENKINPPSIKKSNDVSIPSEKKIAKPKCKAKKEKVVPKGKNK
ncbi:anti-sigma factor domain-containing protein [Caloramator sp. E03]|uniref:anti-sigma factor domain-containing protein n=1 Tax=Caloramator sp. E03 TaxID=2576307 RepID=UPI00111009AD|nr:anti-sigma factor domain-containing protein [Caloramator sp. E03]QCX33213.1 anti-sigma factor domain-containing protein [Caloramator sp. E03]